MDDTDEDGVEIGETGSWREGSGYSSARQDRKAIHAPNNSVSTISLGTGVVDIGDEPFRHERIKVGCVFALSEGWELAPGVNRGAEVVGVGERGKGQEEDKPRREDAWSCWVESPWWFSSDTRVNVLSIYSSA